MQSSQLENCRICGRLFLKDYTDYCLDCYKEVEQEFIRVTDFLKDQHNQYATIEEISECTEVTIKQIADFIRDGRIFAEDFPNLGYPCAHCGKLITRQVLCNNCFEQFSSDVNKTLKSEKLMDEMGSNQQLQTNKSQAQYWKIKKDK